MRFILILLFASLGLHADPFDRDAFLKCIDAAISQKNFQLGSNNFEQTSIIDCGEYQLSIVSSNYWICWQSEFHIVYQGQQIGYASTRISNAHAELSEIEIEEAFRSQGVGSALFQSILGILTSMRPQVDVLEWIAMPFGDNPMPQVESLARIIRFYEQQGAQLVSRFSDSARMRILLHNREAPSPGFQPALILYPLIDVVRCMYLCFLLLSHQFSP